MTDALQLRGVELSTHGKDVLIGGYVPARATTGALREAFGGETADANAADPGRTSLWRRRRGGGGGGGGGGRRDAGEDGRVRFYKSWDRNGALSISPRTPCACLARGGSGEKASWPTVESTSTRRRSSAGWPDPAAAVLMERIRAAARPRRLLGSAARCSARPS